VFVLCWNTCVVEAEYSSDKISDSEESNDSYSELVQSDAESKNLDAVAEPEQRPK
jgi:hypothetical protein